MNGGEVPRVEHETKGSTVIVRIQGDVDAANASQHVVNKPLVARHIHDRDLDAIWQLQPGEPEVDGHAALLLFLEAVGIDASQGSDQG